MSNGSDRLGRPGPTRVAWEQCSWEADPDASLSHRQRRVARGPYAAAVPPEISAADFKFSNELLAEAEDALMEIGRFDAELARALPAADGELAPLAAILLRTESAASSQIEGITAGAKALSLASISEKAGTNAELVTSNVAAMKSAMGMSGDISVESICAAHAALMAGHAYADPGRPRTQQVWIGGGVSPHTASFVPPHHSRVPRAVDDLVEFASRTDLPVLPQVAIAHAQFETIHPFNDGNGRVGRVLVHAMLHGAGATRRMTVPVSAGLLIDTQGYFEALTAYREGDVGPIIGTFSQASFAAVRNGRMLVSDLSDIYGQWTERAPSRAGSAGRRLLAGLLSQPAVNVRYVTQCLSVSQPAAQRAIDQLVDAGVLSVASESKRNRVWLAIDVLEVLDDFAARARRR